MIYVPRMHYLNDFYLLTEIVDKTALLNSIFKLNSRFLVPLNDFLCQIKNTNVFRHLWLNILTSLFEKAASQIKLMVMYWKYCYVVGVIFSNFAGLLQWIDTQILFNMFGKFGRIFFPAAQVGCFFDERMLNKQECVLQLRYISGNIKTGRFSSWDKVFIWKMLSWLCRDPILNKRDFA